MSVTLSYASTLLLAIALAGCKNAAREQQDQNLAASQQALSAAQARENQIEAAQAAAERQKAAEKAALQQSPNAYLETSGIQRYDKGIVNSYAQLSSVTVLNRSHFAVNNLSGDTTWLDASGARFGSTPFQLKGSIPAGDTKTFRLSDGTLSSGTLQGAPTQAKVVFSTLSIVD